MGFPMQRILCLLLLRFRNESGDWCAEDELGLPILDADGSQKCGEGMIMPDGTRIKPG